MMKGRWWMLLLPAGLVLILAAGPSPAGKSAKPTAASSSSADSGFVLCEGIYALCTRALCSPIAGPDGAMDGGLVSCKCSVQSGHSAGGKCQGPKDTPAGKLIFSRYSLIRSYVQCKNSRMWANCVDSPCFIDADNPLSATATCTCNTLSTPSPQMYVATSDFYNPAACTTGIISSATTDQGNAIAQFYESATHMDPYVTITILTPDAGK